MVIYWGPLRLAAGRDRGFRVGKYSERVMCLQRALAEVWPLCIVRCAFMTSRLCACPGDRQLFASQGLGGQHVHHQPTRAL